MNAPHNLRTTPEVLVEDTDSDDDAPELLDSDSDSDDEDEPRLPPRCFRGGTTKPSANDPELQPDPMSLTFVTVPTPDMA